MLNPFKVAKRNYRETPLDDDSAVGGRSAIRTIESSTKASGFFFAKESDCFDPIGMKVLEVDW